MKFELFVSLRYLKSKQKQRFVSLITIISVAGVALGVAALIVVLAVMNGFDNELKQKIIGTNSHIVVQKEGGIFETDYVLTTVKKIPHVVSAAPFVNGQVMIRHEDNIRGALLKGIDVDMTAPTTRLDSYITDGRLDLSDNGIIVGSEYAKKFRIILGDNISLVSPDSGKVYDFLVSGIFTSGMYEYDLNLVFINLENSQKIFNMDNAVSGINIMVDNELRVNSIKKEIQRRLPYPFWARSWVDLNKNLFAALKLEKTVMFVILTLIVLVACFNIASTLIMIVLEKTKDIGILKAIGATRKKVMAIFTFQGFFIGFLGTILGSTLGLALSYALGKYQFIKLPSDIYYIDRLPVLVEPFDTIMIGGAALALSLLAALYPAYSASRFDPVEAIRYE